MRTQRAHDGNGHALSQLAILGGSDSQVAVCVFLTETTFSLAEAAGPRRSSVPLPLTLMETLTSVRHAYRGLLYASTATVTDTMLNEEYHSRTTLHQRLLEHQHPRLPMVPFLTLKQTNLPDHQNEDAYRLSAYNLTMSLTRQRSPRQRNDPPSIQRRLTPRKISISATLSPRLPRVGRLIQYQRSTGMLDFHPDNINHNYNILKTLRGHRLPAAASLMPRQLDL